MAHSGLLRSTPVCIRHFSLLLWMYMEPPWDTHNSSSESVWLKGSGTGAAQWPGQSVRSGMAKGGSGSCLAAGSTVVKPTRRAPSQCCVEPTNFKWILSWISTARLLNTRPFLNVVAGLVASREPWLRETFSPTAWLWKLRSPRQELLHWCDSFSSTTATGFFLKPAIRSNN